MATELVREILRRLGETASIQVVPWARGYQMVQRTPGTGLFATIRSAQREADFKWVGRSYWPKTPTTASREPA